MLGGWVNPHREQQTIPQGQTSIPPKSFFTPTANGQSAPRSGSARGVGRGAGSHTPSTASEKFVVRRAPVLGLRFFVSVSMRSGEPFGGAERLLVVRSVYVSDEKCSHER